MSIFINGTDRTPLNSLVLLNAAAGNEVANRMDYTVNKAAGNDTGYVINKTNILSSGTSTIIDTQINNVSKFSVLQNGIKLSQVTAPTAPTVAVGAAGVLTGTYYYRITFATAFGETECGNLSASVAPSSQQVNLTNIPVSSDATVIARKIYRTLAGGGIYGIMQLVTTISDNTTTAYSDNIADGSLGVYNSWVNSTGGLIYNGSTRAGIIDVGTTAFGLNAGRVTTGPYNVFLGWNAGYSNTIGSYNTLVGWDTGHSNTTGYYNSFFGADAGHYNTTGNNNSFFGVNAGNHNTTGGSNSFFGQNCGFNNSTGGSLSFFGDNTGAANTTGSYNSFFGKNAGTANTTGTENSCFGNDSGYSNTTGYYNIFIGRNAGRFQADGITTLTTANTSIYIGRACRGYNNSDSNSIVIGESAIGIGANSVVLGNDSITVTALKGRVGIGTTAPNANAILDVTSTTMAFMPPRMTTVQKGNVASPTAGMVVYDSTLNKLCVYTGAAWETVTSAV